MGHIAVRLGLLWSVEAVCTYAWPCIQFVQHIKLERGSGEDCWDCKVARNHACWWSSRLYFICPHPPLAKDFCHLNFSEQEYEKSENKQPLFLSCANFWVENVVDF